MSENLEKYPFPYGINKDRLEEHFQENPFEFGKEIVAMRYRAANLVGINPTKKILIVKIFDFLIGVLNDQNNTSDLLDIVVTILGE